MKYDSRVLRQTDKMLGSDATDCYSFVQTPPPPPKKTPYLKNEMHRACVWEDYQV